MKAKLPESPAQRRAALAAIAAALPIILIAEVDLHRRPADQVRGSKRVWRLACLNAVPALIYLGWGRRR